MLKMLSISLKFSRFNSEKCKFSLGFNAPKPCIVYENKVNSNEIRQKRCVLRSFKKPGDVVYNERHFYVIKYWIFFSIYTYFIILQRIYTCVKCTRSWNLKFNIQFE